MLLVMLNCDLERTRLLDAGFLSDSANAQREYVKLKVRPRPQIGSGALK